MPTKKLKINKDSKKAKIEKQTIIYYLHVNKINTLNTL